MNHRKLASFAAAALIGVALVASPAQARFVGAGGWHGGGWHGGGWHGGFVRGPAFVGRRAFVGRPFVHRAFFHRRHFVGPFIGAGVIAAGYSSCWTWVPTAFGWQRAWACGWGSPWGYGYAF